MDVYTNGTFKFVIKKLDNESHTQYSQRCKLFYKLYSNNIPKNKTEYNDLISKSIEEYNKKYYNCKY